LHEHCILKVKDLIAHMSTSTRPSSSAAKPTEYQKPAADTAMLAGGVAKPTALTTIDNASEPSSGVAKPTDAQDWEPSVLAKNMTDMLSCRAYEAGVKKLLSDTTKLRDREGSHWQALTGKAARGLHGKTFHNVLQLPDSSRCTSAIPLEQQVRGNAHKHLVSCLSVELQ
jgi:hypothetical protein